MQMTVLLVVLPLLCAPVTAMIKHRLIGWGITLILTATLTVISGIVVSDVISGDVIHYELGGWEPPWGIAYRIDALNALVALIISLIAFLSTLYAYSSVTKEIPSHLTHLFYATFQLCVLGLMGIALTGDIFNLFVFLEISSLSSYALIALGKHRKALLAAFNYLILGTVGASFFLLGVGMLYAASGSLNMIDIANRFDQFSSLQLVSTSMIFIVLGMALKAAIFPLHSWLPGAYAQAPSVVSIFLAATATKVAIYALIRCLFDVYPVTFWMDKALPAIMIGTGCIAIIYGSLRALGQISIKRLLAYSSVAQIGYMVVGVGLLHPTGMTATLLHLFNHALMKTALFMAAGIFFLRANTTFLTSLQGFGKDMRWTTLALLIGGLSIIGMPGTVGFISKWYLIQAAIVSGHWYVVPVVLAGSLIAILYVWKMVEALYFKSPEKVRVGQVTSGSESIAKTPPLMAITCWLLVLSCIYFGIDPELTTSLATTAAEALFSALPESGVSE